LGASAAGLGSNNSNNTSGIAIANASTGNAGGVPTSLSASSLPALAASATVNATASAGAGGIASAAVAGLLPTNATGRMTSSTSVPTTGPGRFVSSGQQLLKLSPVMTASVLTPEQEVINLICKFPGNIMYKESKNRLENLRREHPHIFQSRALFVTVLHLLDMFTFKLPLRREIVALFSDQAKRKSTPVTSNAQTSTVNTTSQQNQNNSSTITGNDDATSSDSSSVLSTVIDDPLVTRDNTNAANTAAQALVLDQ
jgi:hypothetical protein